MEPDLKALVDDLIGIDPEDGAHSRADLVDCLKACNQTVKAILDPVKGNVDQLDGEHADAMTKLLDQQDAIKARIDAMPTAASVKSRLSAHESYLRTPSHRPGQGGERVVVNGTGTADNSVEFKGDRYDSIGSGESEFEKFFKRGPFKSFGHFALSVRNDAIAVKSGTPRNQAMSEWNDQLFKSENSIKAVFGPQATKAITGLGEFLDSEGGLLIPPEFSNTIWRRAVDDGVALWSYAHNQQVSGNTWVQRAYQDKSRANGSRMGGVRGYWLAEGAQGTGSSPTYRAISHRLNKLMVLIYATEEQLEDAVGLESELSRLAADEIRFVVNDALINGDGTGKPLGLLNAGCKITVLSNNGANATLSASDIDNMWVRRHESNGVGYMWLGNQEIETQLAQAKYLSGATPYSAVWTMLPSGGPAGAMQQGVVPAVIRGKPLIYNEFCAALGTEGDLILWAPKEYCFVSKATGVNTSISSHLRFDYDERVFKFAFRCDGRPFWDQPLTRYKGTSNQTLSPIITLESNRAS